MRWCRVARARVREVARVGEDHDDVIRWYREQLAAPAVFPWAGTVWPPERLGPTWQTDAQGRWLLPDATLGWDVLGFVGCWLQHGRGRPWRYTLEQARFILWWFSLDEQGRFVFYDGVLQRLKGWGKDPMLATICATELIGPARFAGWDGDTPVATDVEAAWIPIAATALAQTRTTMRFFPTLFTPEAVDEFGLQIGKEMIYAYGDSRMIQAVTSSPSVLEGIRATFTVKNETQHWTDGNGGIEMADVIERNAAKGEGGTNRALAATNAPDPNRDSVGLRDREAWELMAEGTTVTQGIMYDSLESHPDAPLAEDMVTEIIGTVQGDSTWLDSDRIRKSVLDPRNSPSRSRRWWYNTMKESEGAWVVPALFDRWSARTLDIEPDLEPGDEIALFFDGSKSDDATGLVGCRLSDGHIVTLGMWQRPPKSRGVVSAEYTAPRAAIHECVVQVFEDYKPVGFFADPSHTFDDQTLDRYWDATIDRWHRMFKDKLDLWATPGKKGHAVMWDMTAAARQRDFTAAAERFVADVEQDDSDGADPISWDGDHRLRQHVRNARAYVNDYGTVLRKEGRESQKKIDLAVCAVGSRMVRRAVLNAREIDLKKKRTGKVW